MKKYIFALLIIISFSFSIIAQQPKKAASSSIFEAVQKLNVLGSVLFVAAHPDDENTRLISYLANHLNARTAYLSLTRGDGGQNLIGNELRELLGVIRTQELLAARSIDGGEQLFTRANDFGYSKHPNETLKIWDKNKVLADVVWAIRNFKPDVIINRFNHKTPGTTHGHHTTSAMLSVEAFDLAGDSNSYVNQLNLVSAWQPKRMFFNTSWWFYGSREKFEKADKSNMLSFDVGVYYPLKGLSNNEVAAKASSQHLCQGFGRLNQRGSQNEYIEFIKGDFPKENSNLFSGIDTSWHRIGKNGAEIESILKAVEQNFNFENPAVHIDDFIKAYQLLQNSTNEHWKVVKSKALKSIIEACLGLYLEVSAQSATAIPGETVGLNIEVLNRSKAPVTLLSYKLSNSNTIIDENIALDNNKKLNFTSTVTIDGNQKYTTPYWLNKKGSLGMYEVARQNLIGLPETPRAVSVDFNLSINNVPFTFTKDVIYRYAKPEKGELYRPFEIIPEASVKLNNQVHIFNNNTPKTIKVTVTSGRDNLNGYVSLEMPKGWQTSKKIPVSINNKGESESFSFVITPPNHQSEGYIKPIVKIDGVAFSQQLVEIDYQHIPTQTVLLPSKGKVVRIDIATKGKTVAYIEGAGDVVPSSLEAIGYTVDIIPVHQITSQVLKQYDAVVVGIRAYNILDELKFKQEVLFDFVKNGGNLIVQYNTNRRLKVQDNKLAPYPLSLSRARVTDENAKVTFLDTTHPILNYPNKISDADFNGWVQERGLYFPNKWDKNFVPLLSINDAGEPENLGSLLVAKYGKGYYIYTGLSFFRQFPAGNPGAYRLFANMISIGK